MGTVFAKFTASATPTVRITRGEAWASDDPLVTQHPDWFTDDPDAHDLVHRSGPPVSRPVVEQTTAAPGEQRELNGPADARPSRPRRSDTRG